MNTGNDVTIKLGVDDSGLPPPIQRTNAAVASIGKTAEVSARQTAAAMRTLPAQLTDVATQLAGGGNPLLVLLQQGGQVKDSFGGITPAVSALRAAISPAAVALGGLTVGVGAASVAALQGVQEFNAYRRAILLTGNEAGVTVGKLDTLARAASEAVGGTQGNAAAVAAQLVAAGDISRATLGPAIQAAVALQRELGVEVGRTVSAFAELGRDPLRAAVSLNQQYNFLTSAVYEQIKALTEQGRAQEAAAVAQEAFASTAIKRSADMNESLGYLEKGWRGVRDMAKSAWDAMVGFGRQTTIDQQIEKAEKELVQAQKLARLPAFSSSPLADVAGRQAQLDALRESRQLMIRAADRQAAEAREIQARAERDAKLAAGARAAGAGGGRPYDELGGFINRELLQQVERDERAAERDKRRIEQEAERQAKQLTSEVGFLQQMLDVNQRAAAELIEDQRAKGEALISLDLAVARRRVEAQGLSGGARDEALRLVDEQGALARRRLEVDLREAGDKLAADTGRELYADTREAISAAFRDSNNPLQAFGAALANTIYTRASASLVNALATAAVGSDGRGGGLGSLIRFIGSLGGSSNPSSINYENSFDRMNPPPLATGTNYVPRNMLARLHEGEAVIPKRYNPAAGGIGGGFHVTNAQTINIDARSDQQQVASLVVGALRESNTALVEDLQARGLIPS